MSPAPAVTWKKQRTLDGRIDEYSARLNGFYLKVRHWRSQDRNQWSVHQEKNGKILLLGYGTSVTPEPCFKAALEKARALSEAA